MEGDKVKKEKGRKAEKAPVRIADSQVGAGDLKGAVATGREPPCSDGGVLHVVQSAVEHVLETTLKTVSIVTGMRPLRIGGKDIRVPITVEVSKESDLKSELILAGPIAPRYGDKKLKCYITVDAQRLAFDAKGNLL